MDKPLSYGQLVDALVSDPGVPFWVKKLLGELAQRDPVDVQNWLAVVVHAEGKRVEEAL